MKIIEEKEENDIENDENGEYVIEKDGDNVQDIEDERENERENKRENERENKRDSVYKDDEKDNGDEEDSNLILAVKVDALCSNRLNEYIKQKYARLDEWKW